MDTHFTGTDLVFLATGLFFVALSLWAFFREKIRLALALLFCAALSFRLLMTFIDPFIHIWDEEFHAMVARNMSEGSFVPVLYKNPALDFTPSDWMGNHVWLHKPPLFLWQIAALMKITGPAVWAVRLPTAVLTSLLVFAVFRMGKLVSGNQTGFLAALFFSVCNLQINTVSGYLNTDHNDLVFMCYVVLSIWAWVEFSFSDKWKWALLTGLFSGMAILVKWLPGLLVFGIWGIHILLEKEKRNSIKTWLKPAGAFLLAIAVAAPWFVYASREWPGEFNATMHLQNRHLAESLDHPGPWYFHFSQLVSDYGWWFCLLLLVSVPVFLQDKNNRLLRTALLAGVIFVYAFYTFIPTRMPLFCIIVSPLLLLLAAEFISRIMSFPASGMLRMTYPFLLFFFSWILLDTGRLEHFHTDRSGDPAREARIHNRSVFEIAARELPSRDYVLFNCGRYANGVACMFYTGITSYSHIPTEEEYAQLKQKKVRIAVFDDIPLPAYLSEDPAVFKVHHQLIRNGF